MVHKVPGHKNLLCSLKQDRSEIERQTKQICIDTVSGWINVSQDEITVRHPTRPPNALHSIRNLGKPLWSMFILLSIASGQRNLRRDHQFTVEAHTTVEEWPGTCGGASVWRADRPPHRQRSRKGCPTTAESGWLWSPGAVYQLWYS